MGDTYDRRRFLRAAASTGVGLGLGAERLAGLERGPAGPPQLAPTAPEPLAAPPIETVRVGVVGVGHRGPTHVRNLLALDGVEVRAICDVVSEKVALAQAMVTEAGQPKPTGYSDGPYDFRRLCGEEELDLVLTATPWEWHAPVCVAAMENGKHAATEVPMTVTIEECWQLVETAERTGRHCVMMENCCYDRTELMILNMVRQGLFGEPLHAECGYLHDLRRLKLTDFYEGRWRIRHSLLRDGDLYPTHGLGPVAQWLDIERGNRFEHVVAFATKSRGLQRWAAEHIGVESPEAKRTYQHGDVVNTLLRTARGETVLITHNTDSPRPYSRRILLQGTRGLIRKYPDEKIHIEGRSPADEWEPVDPQAGAGPGGTAEQGTDPAGPATNDYRAEFEHPLWRQLERDARGGGHGGMDYVMMYRLIEALHAGAPTDMDVYDGAAWTAVAELGERSIEGLGRPVDVPDFTRSAWKTRPPVGLVPAGAGS